MFVLEIPAGGSTLPQQHLYEEIYFVLEGRGSTQLEFADGRKRSFEWGPRSFFAIPLNAKYRHFNASGTQRALLATTTTLPMMMKIFHNEDFIFDTPFEFDDRTGKDEYYAGEGDLHMIRPGQQHLGDELRPRPARRSSSPTWEDRGAGSSNIMFVLADGIMHAHISEIAPATYKKAHRHDAGHARDDAHRRRLLAALVRRRARLRRASTGSTASSSRRARGSSTSTSSPATMPRATSRPASAASATRSPRRDAADRDRRSRAERQAISRSVKEGGNQIEYEDQDPRIHQIWLEEMRKHGITPQLTL